MAMSKSIAVGSIVTGAIMVVFAAIVVICGAVLANKLTGEITATVGLWSLYYAVPGILCIIAGIRQHVPVLGVALFFNIVGIIVSLVASIIAIVFVAAMNAVTNFEHCHETTGDKCLCPGVYYYMNCADLESVRSTITTILVMYIFLLLTTLGASIFGCMGTCCAPAEPVVVVTSGIPVQTVQTGGTVIVASNQTVTNAAYPPGLAMPATYSQAPPPAYDVNQPPAYAEGVDKVAM